jgi:hypothetical protein
MKSGWKNFELWMIPGGIIGITLIYGLWVMSYDNAQKYWGVSPLMVIGMFTLCAGVSLVFAGLVQAIWAGM